jgi:hypothetical protein
LSFSSFPHHRIFFFFFPQCSSPWTRFLVHENITKKYPRSILPVFLSSSFQHRLPMSYLNDSFTFSVSLLMMTAKTVETSRVNKLLCTAAVVLSFIMKILPLNKSNVYSYLWRHYGASTSKLFGDVVTLNVKLEKLKCHLNFLRTCKQERMIPNFARIRLANPIPNRSKLIEEVSMKILQAEIKLKKQELTRCYRHSLFQFLS